MHLGLKNILIVHISTRRENQTIVDKSPWDTYAMLRIICVLELKYEENTAISFINGLLCPLPTQHNVENQLKLHVVVFNIVWGVVGEVRQVKLYLHLACTQKRQK